MKRCLVLLAGCMAAPLGAQQPIVIETGRPAWLGFGYDVRWLQHDGACRPEVVVRSLVQGAPAERAGLRSGDAILALDGQPAGSTRLQLLAARLAPGDSVRLRVARHGAVRELVAVADRRPARPPIAALETGEASGFYSTSAPVIELMGDTLIARNLDSGSGWDRRPSGYWVARSGGRTEWRRLSSRSRGELDRRVADLLVCADTTPGATEPVSIGRLKVQRIQDRADSLRVVIARRALARQEGDREELFRELEERVRERPPHVYTAAPEPGAFRFEDHVTAAWRGVAGAEVTRLEPELAEYFRGARTGVLVLRVSPGTPAAAAGLEPGDVITGGQGRSVDSVDDLRLLVSLPDPTPLELRVVRHGRTRTLTIQRE